MTDPVKLPGDELRDAIMVADEVVHFKRPANESACVHLAGTILKYFGWGDLVEQNRKLDAWATGADERVGEAHQALEDAGIGANKFEDGETRLLRIGERVKILQRYRDELRMLLEHVLYVPGTPDKDRIAKLLDRMPRSRR